MRRLVSFALAALSLEATAAAQCPGWADHFVPPGVEGQTYALHEHDDGSGPRLFVGGGFLRVGDVQASLLAWDGATWSTVGAGPQGPIQLLVTHDDGSGRALYAGGEFTFAGSVSVNGIGRWDGASWSGLGTGLNGEAYAATTFDDGSGSALYVAGEFSTAGGVPALRVARWNGSSWSAVGTGFNAAVRALAVYDDGTGSKLYATGHFTGLNGQAAAYIARWDGVSWSPLGTGLNGGGACLAVHDDGQGPALYVGGTFGVAGGLASMRIARWKAGAWESAGLPAPAGIFGVESFGEYDDGTGKRLYAGGAFGGYGQAPFRIVRWNGSAWTDVGGGIGDAGSGGLVFALETFDSGTGRQLVAAGTFETAGPVAVANIAGWDGSTWSALVPGDGLDQFATALTVHDDGNGRELVVVGYFSAAGRTPASRIASWDGSAWSAFGAGLGQDSMAPNARCVRSFDDGSGPALYVGGHFTTAGGSPIPNIARWNASGWSALGAGIPTGTVLALREYDDGNGARLIAGGLFGDAGGVGIVTIAAWDGASWARLGIGLEGEVWALDVFDSGQGPELIAGGRFSIGPGAPNERLAAWNGTVWRTLGFGSTLVLNDKVFALTSWHDGASESLYAAGSFSNVGGVACANIAGWDGSAWSALGAGTSDVIFALAALPAPSGPGLCVGGKFLAAGGLPAANVARWDGSAWSALAAFEHPGTEYVRGMATYDAGDGTGPMLYVTGVFSRMGSHRSSHIAAYSECGVAGRVVCAGDGSGTACPCGNSSAPGAGAGCVNSTGNAGTLRARGLASLTQDTLVLEGAGMTNGFALYFQGTQRIAGGAGIGFGDGLRCAGGNTVRLEIVPNSAGSSHYPRAGDPPVATKGLVTAPGTRVYQIWFRDAANFCTTSTFNLTNAVEIVWQR